MSKKKTILVLAGVLALGYVVVSTNAFADTSTTPTPVVIVPAVPTIPAVPTTPAAPSGIPAPSGLQSPSTLPGADENNIDDQSENQAGDQTDDAAVNDEDDANVNDNEDGNVSALVAPTTSTDNQGSDNQGQSGSND